MTRQKKKKQAPEEVLVATSVGNDYGNGPAGAASKSELSNFGAVSCLAFSSFCFAYGAGGDGSERAKRTAVRTGIEAGTWERE